MWQVSSCVEEVEVETFLQMYLDASLPNRTGSIVCVPSSPLATTCAHHLHNQPILPNIPWSSSFQQPFRLRCFPFPFRLPFLFDRQRSHVASVVLVFLDVINANNIVDL